MMSVSEANKIVMEAVMEPQQDKARRMYKKAIELDPTSKLANYHLGMIYAGRGLHKDAINHYKIIVSDLDPEDHGIWFLLARQYHLDMQYEKAVEHYKKVYEFDPLACLYISEIYCKTRNNLTEALQYAHKSLELRSPECMVDEEEFLANLKRAEILNQNEGFESIEKPNPEYIQGDLTKASLLGVSTLNPETIEVFMQHGFRYGIRCIGCKGDKDETIEDAAKANGSDISKLVEDLRKVLFTN